MRCEILTVCHAYIFAFPLCLLEFFFVIFMSDSPLEVYTCLYRYDMLTYQGYLIFGYLVLEVNNFAAGSKQDIDVVWR